MEKKKVQRTGSYKKPLLKLPPESKALFTFKISA